MTPFTIWRYPQVTAENGWSRSTILRRIHARLFPEPIALSSRSVGWRAQEVVAVNAAVIRGASEDEIRELVRTLEQHRKSMTPENTMSAPARPGDTRSAHRRARGARPDEIPKT
jgi:prophage regulatory protein